MGADRPADFGSRLRQARERKGVTLREIAARTKISIAFLESLERSEISKLPGGIFSRAFVRSYAKEVGLDPGKTVEEFIGLFPHDSVTAGHARSDQVEDAERFESDRRVASSVLWILLISVPLAGGVLYLGMAQRDAQRAQSGPSQPAKASPEAPAARDTPESTAESVGQPSPAATRAVQAAGSAPPGAASPDLAAPASPPASAPAKDVKDDKGATNVATEGLKIELSARRPVWVSATVDGQKAIGRLLQVGDKEVVDVKRELLLTAGDASAVKMTVNGAEARSLGKNGEVITARVTPANFKDYLLSR